MLQAPAKWGMGEIIHMHIYEYINVHIYIYIYIFLIEFDTCYFKVKAFFHMTDMDYRLCCYLEPIDLQDVVPVLSL